jgi:hypothetical protein
MLAVERVWVLVTTSIGAVVAVAIAVVPADDRAPAAAARHAGSADPAHRRFDLDRRRRRETGSPCLPFVSWVVSKPTWGCSSSTAPPAAWARTSRELRGAAMARDLDGARDANRRARLTPDELVP